jgi:hypothetical protein
MNAKRVRMSVKGGSKAEVAALQQDVCFAPILLKKSFLADERNF